MCTVSMIGDHYRDKWVPQWPQQPGIAPSSPGIQTYQALVNPPVTRAEFDALKREVENMKALLARAKAYDEANGEPDCEMDEKMAVLRKVAEMVGISLDDVIGAPVKQA